MKRFKILSVFLKNSALSLILLFLLMSAALLFTTQFVGLYRYQTYALDLFIQNGNDRMVIFSPSGLMDGDLAVASQKQEAFSQEVESLSGVQEVVSIYHINDSFYNNSAFSIYLYDKTLLDLFPLRYSGFQGFTSTGITEDGKLQVILSGDYFDGETVGEPMEMRVGGKNIEMLPVGKIKFPYITPRFSISGNGNTIPNYFSRNELPIALMTPETKKLLGENVTIYTNPSFLVYLEEDYTQQELEAVKEKLSEYGTSNTYQELIDKTNEPPVTNMENALLLPLAFSVVATIAFLSVSILSIYKKLDQSAILYLCGCSKRRSYLYLSGILAGVGLLAAALTAGYITLLPVLQHHEIISKNMLLLVDEKSLLLVGIYLLFLLLISFGVPWLMMRKYSPLESYRRMER